MDYRYHLSASMSLAIEKCGGLLPCSPYRRVDAAAVGNLVAISPLELFSPQESWARPTVDYLAEHYLRGGLFFQPIIHTGLNPYLSAQMARAFLCLADGRCLDILHSLCRRASPTMTWPEAIHPASGGGCMGDGDHGWSAAEFVNLVRDTLVKEHQGSILLGFGVPADWLGPGMRVRVSRASTVTGTLDYALEAGPEGLRLDWSLDRNHGQDTLPLYLVVPGRRTLLPLVGEKGCVNISMKLLCEESRWNSRRSSRI
jgi:hypothetical protein